MTGTAVERPGLLHDAVLAVAGRLRPALRAAGVDATHFLTILSFKLRSDTRRGQGDAGRRRRRGGLTSLCVTHLVLGGAVGAVGASFTDPLVFATLTLGATMLLLTSALVADFTEVLLDGSDLAVLQPCPVDDRTLFAARLAHVGVYLGLLTGASGVGPLIAGALLFPGAVFAPVFLGSLVLSGVLAVCAAVAVYVGAMRLFDTERFKDLVVGVQIVMVVLVVAGFQTAPHLLDGTTGRYLDRDGAPWLWALPSSPYGALLALALGEVTAQNVALAALGLVLPAGLLVLALRLASGHFAAGLAAMHRPPGTTRARRRSLRERLGQAATRGPTERAGFAFFANMARRERRYKMRTWPPTLLCLFMIALIGFTGNPPFRVLECAPVYTLGSLLSAFALHARYTESPEATWVFDANPLARRGEFLCGAMKALVFSTILPLVALVAGALLLVHGARLLPDLVLSVELVLWLALLNARLLGRQMPFTREFSVGEFSSNYLTILGLMCVGFSLMLVHAAVRQAAWVHGAALAVMVVVLWLQLRSLRALA